jgi:DNA-nicking Smr family endonuclease
MRRKRPLSEDERSLWETVTRAVVPLRRRKAIKPKEPAEDAEILAPKAPPKFVKTPKVPGPAPAVRRSAPLPAAPPLGPIGRKLRQKIGRGSEPIDARIDLHGMTQADAHAALSHFLRRAQHRGARVVLVITGKGKLNTSDPYAERGVLKRQVPLWLESSEMRGYVIGFESASIGHGGAGALYVRVRRGSSVA